MNKRISQAEVFLLALLLAGCITHATTGETPEKQETREVWETLDDVVLPCECKLFSFSPQLDRVLYECDKDWWLASLPDLDDATPIIATDGAYEALSMLGWMPDGKTFVVKSYNLAEHTADWWSVRADNLDDRTHLCTLTSAWRFTIRSPTGAAFVAVDRIGGVILIHTDGSGCEELPIQGSIMKTLSISWSPDGEKIAYVHIPHGEWLDSAEMRTIDLNTRRITTIYTDDIGVPEWFPDGEEIMLFGDENVLPVIRADGSGIAGELETPEGYFVRSGGKWSPDGSRLALYLETEEADYESRAIGILDRDTLVISVFEVAHFSGILDWTPSGNAVVIWTHEDVGIVLKEVPIER